MSITSRSAALAVAAALALLGGGGAAEAHGKHFGFHGFHGHGFHDSYVFSHRPRLRIVIGGGESCGYYYDRWRLSGSFYWKEKYLDCRGWY